ncbi:nucleotidyltransferase domain-containing protein [Paenibacillus sp.]|uniref:nucleotidyltransferase domain-containing protein n=1 Tax=Paenibacillus sp. TaxID=58172 RepID=UPI002D74378B|nr:hypothetical protein [Paenibacillus sp.]HZG85231.1 hypothetical protein [Paenibacillus sp.]
MKNRTDTLPAPLAHAIRTAAASWSSVPAPWLVGGSCGLALHDVPLGATPRDVDIYIDAEGAAAFHDALRDYASDEQHYSETERYRSTLSHYDIGGVTVELVAGFEVRAAGADYRIAIAGAMERHALRAEVGGEPVGVMPLAHELAFNLLRGREDRYEAIAAAMRADPAAHLPALRDIVADNRFDAAWRGRLTELLGLTEDAFAPGEGAPRCRE